MDVVELRPGVTIDATGVAESYTRDLEGQDGVVTSRDLASAVEIRVDMRMIFPFSDAARERLETHPDRPVTQNVPARGAALDTSMRTIGVRLSPQRGGARP